MAGRFFSLFLISIGLTLVDHLWAEDDQALGVSRGSVELLLLSEYETIGLDVVGSDSGILLGLQVQIDHGWYFHGNRSIKKMRNLRSFGTCQTALKLCL